MFDPQPPTTSRRALRARRAALAGPDASAQAARLASTEALQLAGIAVHEVHAVADLAAVRRVFDTVWSADPTNPSVTVELLRAYAHTGQYVVLATDVTEPGRPVIAASVGFFGADGTVHSYATGVVPSARGRSLGFALKLHQRAWALERGVTEITWTFDPLIRRNAWFNLTKLGARAKEYLVDFYGPMADGLNTGDDSDRLYLSWPLLAPEVVAACAGRFEVPDITSLRADGAATALGVGPDGRSPATVVPLPVVGQGPDVALVQVPPDIEALRQQDLPVARSWRQSGRRVLLAAMESGWTVAGFGRDGTYVLRRGTA